MAKKRRTKKRKGTSTRQDPAQGVSSSMSTTDELASHSSDGLSSGMRESESTATDMTSVMGTEEGSHGVLEADEEWNSEEEEEMEMDDDDNFSVFAPSHYPRPSESHRTEMPYMTSPNHMDM